jgi:hypothetical protein
MRIAAAATVAFWSLTAHAEVPAGITQRVVTFIANGCDFFHAEPTRPRPLDDRKHATHFGTIAGAKRDGLPMRYSLKVAAFPGWDVSFWHDNVELKLPAQVAITMGDLQRFLGPDSARDVMYAMSGGDQQPPPTEEREFEPQANRPTCRVHVVAERDAKKGPARRVFAIVFSE